MEVFQGQRECLAERSEPFTRKRDDTNESMISLRMREKKHKKQRHWVSNISDQPKFGKLNIRQILANYARPTAFTFLYEIGRFLK